MNRMLSSLLVATLLMAASAQAQKAPLTTHQVCGLKSVGTALVDPSGEYIAYTRSIPRDALVEDGGARTELWLTRRGEGEGRRFMSSAFGGLSWHPSGKALLFTAKRGSDKVTSLYTMPLNGGEASKILSPEASIRYYSMSADGSKVAYVCNLTKKKSAWVARGFDQVVFGEEKFSVALFIHDIASGKSVRVAVQGSPWEVGFSPDSSKLAFWASPESNIDDRYMARSLWVCEADGKKVREVAPNRGKVGVFHWSPDSSRIAFIQGADIHDPKESTLRIAAASPAGGKAVVRTLTPADYPGHVADMRWVKGRDGSDGLVLLVNEGLKAHAMYQSASGGPMMHLNKAVEVDEAADASPVWRSLEVHQAKDGSFAFVSVAESAAHPRELFIDGKRITRSNKEVLGGAEMGRQEEISYTSRDGIKIEGVLIYPVGYQKGKRYPLICMIHGGPEAHYANAWLSAYSMPGQVAAGKGYFVFHPNYRSSTGRGVAFSMLGQGKSARGEFDDIVDGVDHLVKLGLVDTDRVGITGGSYGGYASAWGATYYSDRFAASVMFVGISEQISKIFTTDIPKESYLVHWRMRPWGNWQKYLEASPLYYVERAKTPILILHGEKDPRVPVAQSIELYRALQVKGDVPSRLILYPREQHGNRNSAARLDYGLRQMRWFDNYLKGEGAAMPPVDLDYEKKD